MDAKSDQLKHETKNELFSAPAEVQKSRQNNDKSVRGALDDTIWGLPDNTRGFAP